MTSLPHAKNAHRSQNFNLALVLSVAFFDFISYALIIPLIPLLVLNTPFSLLAQATTDQARYLFLGLLLSTYPLAQFLGSPLLGALSDKLSRKRILTLSFAGNTLGYTACLIGALTSHIEAIFLGHFLSGITGANIPTTNAIISDHTRSKNRTRRFSLSTMSLGSAFIIGPYISGRLIKYFHEPHVACLFIFSFSIVLSCLNTLVIHFFFYNKDTAPPPTRTTLFHLIHDVKSIFHQKGPLRLLFASVFSLFFGWYFFIKFFQVFLIEHLKMSHQGYCNILSYFGLCCLATQILFYLFFSKRLQEHRTLCACTISLSLAIFSFFFLRSLPPLVIAVTIFSASYSLIAPSLTFVISEFGSENNQGKIMGLYQSVQSFAKVLAPGLAGLTMAFNPLGPILISCILIASASALFYQLHQKILLQKSQA